MADILELALILLAVASPFLIAMLLKHYFQYKSETANKLAELDLKLAQNENELLRQQVEGLQKRVETLEAVVTEESYDLNRRIANL